MKTIAASLSALLLLSTGSLAQGVFFGAPAPGTTVKSGDSLNVQVSLQESAAGGGDQLGLIISFRGCETNPCCDDTNNSTSIIVYNGPYNPQVNPDRFGFSQNFTVTVPSFGTAPGTLILTHLFTLGAAGTPTMEIESEPINIIGAF